MVQTTQMPTQPTLAVTDQAAHAKAPAKLPPQALILPLQQLHSTTMVAAKTFTQKIQQVQPPPQTASGLVGSKRPQLKNFLDGNVNRATDGFEGPRLNYEPPFGQLDHFMSRAKNEKHDGSLAPTPASADDYKLR